MRITYSIVVGKAGNTFRSSICSGERDERERAREHERSESESERELRRL
jgi:hypothetical protein